MDTEIVEIKNRWTGEVIFSAEVGVTSEMGPRFKLGLAARLAVKKRANLARANLAGADLAGTDLAGAYLAGAYLAGTNLAGADLADADLAGAYLVGANLAGAYLADADLAGADLAGAYLAGTNLAGADLADADLAGAYLVGANLAGTDLAGAYLARANLAGADLAGAKNIKLPPFQIPQEGELIVWKKLAGGKLCKLRIPPDARRTASVVGRKCRAEFAEVLEGNGTSWRPEGQAITYAPGETVRPDGYDDNPLVECAQGIHFFLTREEAEAW